MWKEECAFSFKTPFDEAGLFLNLETYQAYSMNYVGVDHDRSGNALYLRIKYTKVEKEEEKHVEQKKEAEQQPSKLAIGVEGGFDVDTGKRWEVVKDFALVLYPRLNDLLPFPSQETDIPMSIVATVEAIIKRDDAFKVRGIAQQRR